MLKLTFLDHSDIKIDLLLTYFKIQLEKIPNNLSKIGQKPSIT